MNIIPVIKSIKTLFGDGVVRLVELEDDDLQVLIELAYSRAKPYISERKYLTKSYSKVIDLSKDGVQEVLRLFPSYTMSNGVSNQNIEDASLMFDFQAFRNVGYFGGRITADYIINQATNSASQPDYDIPFEFIDGRLYISPGYITSAVTIEAIVDISLEDVKDERVITWIEKYSLALAKERVGRIRSKFTSPNLPIQMDGSQLLQEANTEKAKLESELEDKGFGQLFTLR